MRLNPIESLRPLWRDLSLTVKGCILLVVPIVVLVAGFASFSESASEEEGVRGDLATTIKIREDLTLLVSDLFAMESFARGLLLTQGKELRAPYLDARQRATEDLKQLDLLLSNDPRRAQRLVGLRPLVGEKIAATGALVAAASSPKAAVEPLVLRSVAAMRKVRDGVQVINEEAGVRQAKELAELDRSHRRTLRVGSGAISVGLLASLTAMIFFARMVRRRIKALQLDARALKMEAPLSRGEKSLDEFGELRSELERTSESLARRAATLRARHAQTQAIVDHTTAAISVQDLESRFLLLNRAYEKSFGLNGDQALGRSPVELFGEKVGGQLRANDLVVLESRQPAQFKESIVVQGKYFTYLSVKAPLFDTQGEVYGLCGVSTDITDYASALGSSAHPQAGEFSAPFLPAEELRAVAQLAGAVGHDLNNILVTIIGYSSLLSADLPAEERKDSSVAKIHDAAERAAVLAQQLLALSGPAPERLRVVEAEELVAELVIRLEPMAGDLFLVDTQVDAATGRIKVDPAQIEQVLLNLCINARDAMPDGGTISITAKATSIRKGAGSGQGSEFAAISVHDQGEGIPPELQARMYEPFFGTKEAGTAIGLGLTVSSMIAQQNGGWLQCKSEVGVGTTFTLFLPQSSEAASEDPKKKQPPALPLGRRETVLVVDDDRTVGELEALLLRTLGYQVILAGSGEEAERAVAKSGAIDLVVTDLHMPRMNGLQLIQRMKRRNPKTKFILTSGDDAALNASPRTAVLNKPFEIKELAATVRTLLDV